MIHDQNILNPASECTELRRSPDLVEGLKKCRAITRKYGTSFYFATQFFPREVREGIYAIYAFARIPDEIVDDPKKGENAETLARLDTWRSQWLDAMRSGGSDDEMMNAIVYVFNKFSIPVAEGEAFLKSMFMDEEKLTYQTYAELEEYMYGSAAVIGLMVTRIVGYSSDQAFEYAAKLGYAFQITNFLRDIREDYDELGRIYMPSEEMGRFGLSSTDIAEHVYNDKFTDFMKFQISRNRQIYRDARSGIPMLAWRGRLAVKISYVLYQAILTEIERVDHNIYLGRVRTTLRQKVWLTAKVLVGIYE